MTWFDAWLSKLDPNQAPFIALVWIVIFFVGAFFWLKWWPWYTQVAYPARQKREEARQQSELRVEQEQTVLLNSLTAAVVEMKVLAAQQMLLLQQHSLEAREDYSSILDHLRTVIDKTVPRSELKGSQ